MNLTRRGPIAWTELSEQFLADLWHRTCEHRERAGRSNPPDHLRPRLAEQSTGETND